MSSWFKDFTDQVQSALPTFDDAGGILQSLTLTTPELAAERRRIDAEEKRKEEIRNALSGMLPWQTRDPDRDILVEECKDAILSLSQNKETFFGPFPLPPMKTKSMNDDDTMNELNNVLPSNDSLEKLAKLQPLPALLDNFEFLAHVGLIEKVLQEDPNLVLMQSTLSGGGARERIFWKNYFFHCAYTRYEAGLSIDEIWSESHAEVPTSNDATVLVPPSTTLPIVSSTSAGTTNDEFEETITFDTNHVDAIGNTPATNVEGNVSLFESTDAVANTTIRSESDFELVDDDKLLTGATMDNTTEIANTPVDDCEYEMDELEAEIARELED